MDNFEPYDGACLDCGAETEVEPDGEHVVRSCTECAWESRFRRYTDD